MAIGDDTVTATNVLIATGSVAASLPGVDLSQDRVDTSTEAIAYTEVPKKLVVIGAGVIGLELGSVWRRLGSEVTVLEYLDRILPGMDTDLAKEAHKIFKKQGIKFELGSKVTGVKTTAKGVSIERDGAAAVDRRPRAGRRGPQAQHRRPGAGQDRRDAQRPRADRSQRPVQDRPPKACTPWAT